MRSIQIADTAGTRARTMNWINRIYLLDITQQRSIIGQLYLGHRFSGEKIAKQELNNKLSSYRSQDGKNHRLSLSEFITYEELLEKLIISELRCYYCRARLQILYERVRAKNQWTLDRLDNQAGHTCNNTVIACLHCNLQKRCRNEQKFLFTKQMRLIKKN